MSDLRDFTGKAEVYGFTKADTDADGIADTLTITTTNGGQTGITNAEYNAFDEVLFAPIGYSFSLNANGHLIATIDN